MTALEVISPDLQPTTQEQLSLARLERKVDRLTELVEQTIADQKALEQRVERFIDPAMDIAATLHGIGEIVAKINAATQAQGKALTQHDTRLTTFIHTIETAIALSSGFDNDPSRQAQT